MKYIRYMTFLLSGILATESWAQDYLNITKKDGSVVSFPLSSIDKLTFSNLVTGTPEEQAMAMKILSDFTAFPNPANDYVNLNYELAQGSPVVLELYNEKGVQVNRVDKGFLSKGTYQHVWNTADYASGLYLCKIVTNQGIEPKKIVVTK